VKRLAAILGIVIAVSACDSLTGPKNRLEVSGTVVASADGNGLTTGQVVEGVTVTLVYSPPLKLQQIIRDSDVTGADGAFTLHANPPEGQTEVACSTLTLTATKVGFLSVTEQLSDYCDTATLVTDVELSLTPNE